MSEGLFSRHATLNAGAIPASAEELSQRYMKLFQQYSRLKAQHAVLKKAVIKEQASNIALQGNVKEKEKELRKLQEQLDLLAFHNDRLTKRIQAVQDSDQKGTHYSLLGGSVKKELEKNAKALDEANMDLERKIQENEKLHEELTERQFEFTDSINSLLKQIQDLEKRVQELSDENINLATDTTPKLITPVVDEKEQIKLLKEIETLKTVLKEKSDLMDEQDQQIQENDQKLLSEIHSLRSILLAKVGDLKNPGLYEHVPEGSSALVQLEKQARLYFSGDKVKIKELPHEIAEKLALSEQTYSQEFTNIVNQLNDSKKQLDKLLLEKEQAMKNNKADDLQKQYDSLHQQHKEHIKLHEENLSQYELELKSLKEKIESHQTRAKEQEEVLITYQEKLTSHQNLAKEQEVKYGQLDAQINEKTQEIAKLLLTIEANEKVGLVKAQELENINIALEQNNTKLQEELEKQKADLESAMNHYKETEKKDVLEKEEETFVYPKAEETPKELISKVEEEEDEEEDEEVFVYRGKDAVEPSIDPTTKKVEESISVRELKLKAYYEQQISNLTEKIQVTDSKAVRFASMYKSLKERSIKEDKEKQMMLAEIEKLNRDVKNVQDLLTTTESNYQKQVDAMTEFISSLQQNTEEQQRHHQPSGRRSNNYSNNYGSK